VSVRCSSCTFPGQSENIDAPAFIGPLGLCVPCFRREWWAERTPAWRAAHGFGPRRAPVPTWRPSGEPPEQPAPPPAKELVRQEAERVARELGVTVERSPRVQRLEVAVDHAPPEFVADALAALRDAWMLELARARRTAR
jgi:hypothetical protein